ncbi:XVIPCD domain-containing protein [Vulcaniibacterium gelatinicum]|uniref:XVIPCD domain-containing protein n=1 Tax=Vulcaniibacterium gelatinicum TaxID=2598725 RepID=UPI0011C8BAAF|nr:XVIPCD domain-containing protein [Vulcaniibacterium gelatinicum]
MPTLSPHARAIVAAFGTQPGVTPDHVGNLQAAIDASPVLIERINAAVAQGHLKAIMPLTHPNAGGEYDPVHRVMRLPLERLTTPPYGPTQGDRAKHNAGEITFVLGHELEHGFNRIATQQANAAFAQAVRRIAKHDPAPRDYTAPLAARLAQNRRDEAVAQIAGWNAIVSRVRSTNPKPGLQDIYDAQPGRMADFITRQGARPNYTYTLKSGFTLDADHTLSPTPANVEAMGRHFFDKAASDAQLGPLGNSDYANYYARSAVSFIAQIERHYHPPRPGVSAPQLGLDLARLRLSEQLLEENGIDLGRHTQPLPYYDLGSQPPAARLFQHTKTTHQHVWPVEADLPEAASVHDGMPARTPADPGHPDHALLETLRVHVRALDRQAGKGWDEYSDRLAASALVMAKRMGFTARDELHLACNRATERYAAGEILHLARTGPYASADPAANLARMPTAEALAQPAEARYRQLAATAEAQPSAWQAQRGHVPVPDDAARCRPGVRM